VVFEVEITQDIPYGSAFVDYNEGSGPFAERQLLLDMYAPVCAEGGRPALILAFGGAFHRGAKDNDVRPEDGPKNTNIAEYCRRFAARGYVCFSIEYRLTQSDPHPGFTPTLGPESVPTSRIDVVRKILDLPPATSEMLRCAQEAAIDDITTAYRFVVGEAVAFGIGPERVAIGGFSAGGRMASTAALAEAISPAAVVALSGVCAPTIVDSFHASGRRRLPFFLAWGEDDLDYVIPGAETMVSRFDVASHPYHACRLPGQTHFYPAECEVECSAGPRASLEHAIEVFLDAHL
jgi:acetyl esterase/lipase